MKKKIISAVLIAALCLSSAACAKNNSGKGSGDNGNAAAGTEYFDIHKAGPNMELSGLTEKGKKQENLVIPAGVIISGTIIDGVVKNVSFESDDDVKIGMLVSTSKTLETIKLPANITKIDAMAFTCCPKLKEITLPKGITVIPDSCFMSDESLETVTIEGDVTEIGSMAFYGCTSLKSINLPDSITTIGDSAFSGCESLESITLPKGLKRITNSAAFNPGAKGGLKEIIVPKEFELESTEIVPFCMVNTNCTVKVVEGSWADTHFNEVFQGKVTKEYV